MTSRQGGATGGKRTLRSAMMLLKMSSVYHDRVPRILVTSRTCFFSNREGFSIFCFLKTSDFGVGQVCSQGLHQIFDGAWKRSRRNSCRSEITVDAFQKKVNVYQIDRSGPNLQISIITVNKSQNEAYVL
jgi:hypothetical protein